MNAITSNEYYPYITSTQPGNVGQIGDPLTTIQLRHSAPEFPLRFAKNFYGPNAVRCGNNVQDGSSISFTSGGMGPRGIYSKLSNRNNNFKTQVGTVYKDIVPTDRLFIPKDGPLPQFGFKSQIANLVQEQYRGDKFLPYPLGYRPRPGDLPRGGTVPVITNISVPRDIPIGEYAEPSMMTYGMTNRIRSIREQNRQYY